LSDEVNDFLLISKAVARLEAGMFGGGLKRPEPVEAAKRPEPVKAAKKPYRKKSYRRASIGWSLQRQRAAALVDAAIMSGDLSVQVDLAEDGAHRMLQVPLQTLGRLVRTRGGLPDHAIRPMAILPRDNLVTPELLAALSKSAMYLRGSEFDAWYNRLKSRGRWASQRPSKAPRIGRPSKQTAELRTSIIARVEEGSWSGAEPVARLVRLLALRGAPLRNTVKRAVDQLYIETGDPRYRIIPRTRAR
jgi:hypothetical protein